MERRVLRAASRDWVRDHRRTNSVGGCTRSGPFHLYCYRVDPLQAQLTHLPVHVRFRHRRVLHLKFGARQHPVTPLRYVRQFQNRQMVKAFQTSSSLGWKRQAQQSQ
jgi:hypothetical protein